MLAFEDAISHAQSNLRIVSTSPQKSESTAAITAYRLLMQGAASNFMRCFDDTLHAADVAVLGYN